MNSMGQYWLCCYYGKNCSVLMFALIWINICVCPYLGVTWEPRRSRCWVGPASPAITKSLLHEHPSNRLTYQNSYLKYKGKNSTSAINNRVDAILFFIVYRSLNCISIVTVFRFHWYMYKVFNKDIPDFKQPLASFTNYDLKIKTNLKFWPSRDVNEIEFEFTNELLTEISN